MRGGRIYIANSFSLACSSFVVEAEVTSKVAHTLSSTSFGLMKTVSRRAMLEDEEKFKTIPGKRGGVRIPLVVTFIGGAGVKIFPSMIHVCVSMHKGIFRGPAACKENSRLGNPKP